jgi:hypothetical protein
LDWLSPRGAGRLVPYSPLGKVDLLGAIAGRKHANPAQIALAGLLARKPLARAHPRRPKAGTPGREHRSRSAGPPANLQEIESAAAQIIGRSLKEAAASNKSSK